MIYQYNLQPDLCCVDYGAVKWPSPDSPQGSSTIEYRYLSIFCNILVILPEEYNVYNYVL